MKNVKFNFANIDKIKDVAKKYVIDKIGSFAITGYPSIDKPWEKGKIFTAKKIKIPYMPYALTALSRPDFMATKEVIACHESILTRDEIFFEAYELAKALKKNGIKKGDMICLSMNESPEATIVEAACSFIGAVSINLPTNIDSNDLAEMLKEFNCSYYFVSDEYRKMAEKTVSDLPNIPKCIVPTDRSFKNIENLSTETKKWLARCKNENPLIENEIEFEKLYNQGAEYKCGNVIENLNPEDPAKILFTSGTTNKPKPIYLSNGSINAELIRLKNHTHMNLGKKGISLKVVLDMYPYGNIVSKWFPIYVGKCTGLTPILNSTNADYYMYMYQPVYSQGTPDLYKSFKYNSAIKENGINFLKYAVTGGMKYDAVDKEEDNAVLKKLGSSSSLLDGAGVSEMIGCVSTAVGSKYNIKSAGKPMVGINIKILEDIDGVPFEELPEKKYNENGIICYSGDTMMIGYYNKPELTDSVIFYDKNGVKWYASDGLGYIDEKGYLYITGRKARCFIACDEEDGKIYKVSPEEIEGSLKRLDLAKDTIVVPMTIKNSDGNERKVVKLYVRFNDDRELTEEEKNLIYNYCKNNFMAKCNVPYKIEQWYGEWPKLNGAESKIDYKMIQKVSDEQERQSLGRRI